MLDGMMKFLQSPRGAALGASLLQQSGYSENPPTLGQAFGKGILDMQAADKQDLESQLTQTKIGQSQMQQRAIQEFLGGLGGSNIPSDRLNMARLMAATGNYDKLPDIISPKEEYGAPHAGLDENGKPTYFQTNKSGGTRKVGGFTPIPNKGMSVTVNPNGTVTYEEGGWEGDVNKPVATEAQKDLMSLKGSLDQLGAIAKDYQSNYLTYAGQALLSGSSIVNKIFGTNFQKEFVQGQTKFKNGVERLFNQYRKEITGAGAAVKELERLRDSMLNTDQSADEFEASFEQFKEVVELSIKAKQEILQKGFKFGTKNYQKELDAAVLGNAISGKQQDNISEESNFRAEEDKEKPAALPIESLPNNMRYYNPEIKGLQDEEYK